MAYTLDEFRAEFPDDEACLARLMEDRYGGTLFPCPACERQARFRPVLKRRAYACDRCGHCVFPCVGTPLAKLHRPLGDWFYALQLLAKSPETFSARELRRQLRCSAATAAAMEQELRAFHARSAEPKSSGLATGAVLAAPHPDGMRGEASAAPPSRKPSRGRSIAALAGSSAALLALVTVGFVLSGRTPMNSDVQVETPNLDLADTPMIEPTPEQLERIVALDTLLRRSSAEIRQNARPPPTTTPTVPLPPMKPATPRPGSPLKLSADEVALLVLGDAKGPVNPNEVLTFGPIKIRRHLVETILKAARVTNSDPVLLMAIADKESSFATEVKAKTSSATGLYQFIEATWLRVLREFGAKHGYDKEAKAIVLADSKLTVTDPAERERILDLRREPYLSALMAAEMLKKDAARIARRIGRELTHGEIYLAHFLGADGAERFMEQLVANPSLVAADLLPNPARANKPIFYVQRGDKEEGLSVGEVHQKFQSMMGLRLDRYKNVHQLIGATASEAQARPTKMP